MAVPHMAMGHPNHRAGGYQRVDPIGGSRAEEGEEQREANERRKLALPNFEEKKKKDAGKSG